MAEKTPTDIEILNQLEAELGLPPNFIIKLQKDDDWSFVVKIHSLIETAASLLVSKVLVEGLKSIELGNFMEPEFKRIFSKLSMGNPATGKIAFIRTMGLLGLEEQKYIQGISELRNNFVHDVKNTGTSLANWVENLDAGKQKSFTNLIGCRLLPHFTFRGKEYERDDFILGQPREAILIGGYGCMKTMAWARAYFGDASLLVKIREGHRAFLEKQVKDLFEILERRTAEGDPPKEGVIK